MFRNVRPGVRAGGPMVDACSIAGSVVLFVMMPSCSVCRELECAYAAFYGVS